MKKMKRFVAVCLLLTLIAANEPHSTSCTFFDLTIPETNVNT